jgi:tetratricopeptide (TPR) repeat protein
MFQSWRFTLRRAEEAYKCGRLDEARQVLGGADLMQYLPAQKLSAKVAEAMARRASRRISEGDTQAGWEDLQSAEKLAGQTEQLVFVRGVLVDRALAEIDNYLRADDPTGALLRIESLEQKGLASDKLRTLKEVCRRLEKARGYSRVGKFAEAEAQLASAVSLRPELSEIADRRKAAADLAAHSREQIETLHRAQAEGEWSKVLALACELLEVAPEHPLARDARKRAWAEVGAKLNQSGAGHTQHWKPTHRASGGTAVAEPETKTGTRFLLWVDAVGGYLVCLENDVLLGQASPGNPVDVPILGDVARRHARIRRQGEGYLIEPIGSVSIEGRPIHSTALLADGDEVQLGSSVRFRFRKPHALSATARLEFVGRQRVQPSCDAVLLMAESCVLGPNWHNHIVCRDWDDDVVLYRQEDELFCRAMDTIEVDGLVCDGRGRISCNSRVAGESFSLSLEEVQA